MKICSKCKKTLTFDNFHKELKVKDGFHRWCKNCQKEYRLVNVKREQERQRIWTIKNKQKRLKQNKKAYWRNRNKIRTKRKIWSLENRELVSQRWKNWAERNGDYLKTKKSERKARILNNGGLFTKRLLAVSTIKRTRVLF